VTTDDRGSAVVEFVLVSVLVVALVAAVLQLALALHIRNTLVAAASEGARMAASADRSPSDGAAHTARLIRATLPDVYARDVTAGYEDVRGVPTVVVEVRAQVALLGWLGPADSLVVRGHALEEESVVGR
jgi:Flp pilus assembly protein TadG